MTIKTIIETELDKIHGKDTYFIDTDREEVEKTIDRIISTLLDEIEKDIGMTDIEAISTFTDISRAWTDGYNLRKEKILSKLNKYRV